MFVDFAIERADFGGRQVLGVVLLPEMCKSFAPPHYASLGANLIRIVVGKNYRTRKALESPHLRGTSQAHAGRVPQLFVPFPEHHAQHGHRTEYPDDCRQGDYHQEKKVDYIPGHHIPSYPFIFAPKR
jgi:hypothetical protein